MPGIPPPFFSDENDHQNEDQNHRHLPEDSIEKLLLPPTFQKFSQKDLPFLKPRKKNLLATKKPFFGLFFLGLLFFFGGIFFNKERIFLEKNPTLTFLKAEQPDFILRENYLNLLHKELLAGKKKEFVKASKIKILWGKGGFGKSELAIEFANRYFSQFSLIWTFYCDTKEHLDQGYRDIAERLNLCSQQEPIDRIKEKVNLYLENASSKRPWLLIYDNVENEPLNLPQRGGVILVTSQKKILSQEFLVEITPFSKEESLLLLEKITGEERSFAMEKLVEDLEGIPLLVNCAGHYIKATPGCDIAEYQKLFSSCLLKKDGAFWQETDNNKRYLKSLGASWEFPLKALEKENPKALELLYVCSYLHPENICAKWIDSWLDQKAVDDKRGIEIDRGEILKALTNYGIIRYENESNTFSLHRFFQHLIRETRKDHLEEDLGQAFTLLAKYAVAMDFHFKKSTEIKEDNWWYLHACEAVKWLDYFKVNFSRVHLNHVALLYKGIAIWCDFNEKYSEGLQACIKAIELRESIGEFNTSELGILYDGKGWLLYTLDQYDEALKSCYKARDIQMPYLKDYPLDYARTTQTINTLLTEQGEYEKALEYGFDALKLRRQYLGKNDVRVSKTLENISRSLRGLGRYEEAKQLSDEAIEIYKKCNKEDHQWFVFSLVSGGWTHFFRKNYQEALKVFLQAESHNNRIIGKFAHLSTGHIECLNGIGWCYIRLKKFKKARQAFEKSLEATQAKQATYGKNDRLMIEILDGIGWSYIEEGEKEKGLKYLKQKVEISEKIFPNMPRLTSIYKNYEEAKSFNNKTASDSEERNSFCSSIGNLKTSS